MEFPKFVLVSDGYHTGLLLDGIFFGKGIKRLDFSTENKDGNSESTIRVMDLDIRQVSLIRDEEKFTEYLKEIAEREEDVKKFLDGFSKQN